MLVDIITIFPSLFPSYLNESILKRAQQKKLVTFRIHNLRDWAEGKHKKVDDRPYGGGPGMVMRADVILKCLGKLETKSAKLKTKTILLDAGGKPFTQITAKRYSKLDRLILICGHYEGVDARVHKFIDERVSVGPYVLTGGELPALTIIDAVTRLLPGVLGDDESSKEESHMVEGYKEYPQYTRPETIEVRTKDKELRLQVPKVLLSGNHKKINEWRTKKAKMTKS